MPTQQDLFAHLRPKPRGRKERQWDELLWDRKEETGRWAAELKALLARHPGMEVYAFFNNHCAGYAPGSLELFARAWQA